MTSNVLNFFIFKLILVKVYSAYVQLSINFYSSIILMINLLCVKYREIKGNDTKEVVINTKKFF